MKRIIAILLFLISIFAVYPTTVFANDVAELTAEPISTTDIDPDITLYRHRNKIYMGQPFQSTSASWVLYKVEPYSEYCYRENGYITDHYRIQYYSDVTYEFVKSEIKAYSSWDPKLTIEYEYSNKGYVYNTEYNGTGHELILEYALNSIYEDQYGRTYYYYGDTKYYYIGSCNLYNLRIYSEYYYHYYAWDDWSEWSEIPVEASDNLQVETKLGKKITYIANGGINAPSSIAIGVDEPFAISTDAPIREGYQFLGWSTSASGDVEYLPGDTCLISSSTNLYAIWDFVGMITVHTLPFKTQYTVGESLDTEGLVILLSRLDGSKALITEGYTVSGFDSSKLGNTTVSVTYEGYTATFTVSVVDKGLCGGNVIWTYDGEGRLTISGTGSMGSYSATDMPWYNYLTAITTVVIETGVTRIGNYAFYGCNNLTSVSIPDSVTRIGSYAFGACESLRNIVIPDSVTGIGESALSGCARLESITIPFVGDKRTTSTTSSLNPLGYIFGTTKYSNGTATTQHYGYSTYDYSKTYYIPCSLKSVTVTDSDIPNYAFEQCRNITDITLGSGVTSIGDNAFYYCSSLKNLSIGESVTSIGSNAFYNCYNLSDILIGNSVTSIGSKAFSDCTKLTNITIGNGLTKIDAAAFEDCTGLKNVYITDIKAWCEIDFVDSYANPLTLADYLYLNNKLVTDVIITDGATVIGDYAFYSYDNLATVGIPETVTVIEKNAFGDCNNLTDVYYAGTAEQWTQITSTIPSYYPIREAFVEYNYDLSSLGHTHSYGKWTVVSPSTFTTNGLQKKVCSICGDTVTEALDLLVGKVSHWNIVLEDDYAVNFYLQISESIESTAKVKISIGNETLSHNISAMEKTGDGYYKVTVNISAAQMNDQIIVIVMNGRDIGSTSTYTAREYCDIILADSTYSRYHALVKEMLNYGAMAQIYFDYDAGYLANEGITGTATTEIPEIAEDLTVTDKVSDLSFYGASLVYRDRIAVRYYFTGDVTGCAFSANGNTYTPVSKDGMYYIEIADILPQNLDQQITLTVTDASGNTLTVTYGPMNYIVRMNAKGNDNLKNLLKALYNYHLTAKRLSKTSA